MISCSKGITPFLGVLTPKYCIMETTSPTRFFKSLSQPMDLPVVSQSDWVAYGLLTYSFSDCFLPSVNFTYCILLLTVNCVKHECMIYGNSAKQRDQHTPPDNDWNFLDSQSRTLSVKLQVVQRLHNSEFLEDEKETVELTRK